MGRFVLLAFAIMLVGGVHWLKPVTPPGKKVFAPPPQGIINYTLGYNDLMASLFWVRVVQDLFVCEQDTEKFEPRPSFKGEEDPLDDILGRKLPPPRCRLGWVYDMVDIVTDLDPAFRKAFEVGGTFLSVAVDDREGASRIFAKGLQFFPEDWRLLFAAAYNELFEMQRPEEAAQLLKRAADRGAPPWIYSLAAGLYSKLGQAHFAKSILESVLARNPEGPMVGRLKLRLDKINKQLGELGSRPPN